MTLVSSGQISMGDINVELGRSRTAQISINSAQNGTIKPLRQAANPKPSPNNTATISEWYGYQHVVSYVHYLWFSNNCNPNYTLDAFYAYSNLSSISYPMNFYSNASLTTVFNGGGFDYTDGSNQKFTINSSGVLISISACGGDTTPPTPPNFVVANTYGDYNIEMFWNGATDNVGVVSYTIYKNGDYIIDVIGTTWTDYSLGDGCYYYQVQSVDAAGNVSELSDPTNLICISGSPNQNQ